jgi:hypothetical protein
VAERQGDPGDLACPVWGCRLNGARWVDVHGWELAICGDHADDVEDRPDRWRVTHVRADGTLRIASTDGPAPDGWKDEPKGAADGTS